jgi:excisionase family DNA binding protein
MLSVKDAAKELGVSASLIYRLCAAGRIRHERHGLGRGTIRIPHDALDEYRKAAEAKPAAPTVGGLRHITLR